MWKEALLATGYATIALLLVFVPQIFLIWYLNGIFN